MFQQGTQVNRTRAQQTRPEELPLRIGRCTLAPLRHQRNRLEWKRSLRVRVKKNAGTPLCGYRMSRKQENRTDYG